MRTLPLEFKRKGFEYKQVDRNNKAAIYSQSLSDKILAYEVFKVKILPAYNLGGVSFEKSEPFPFDEAFGLWAWSIKVFNDNVQKALDRANIKFNQLTNAGI